jgi:hypothetical protein
MNAVTAILSSPLPRFSLPRHYHPNDDASPLAEPRLLGPFLADDPDLFETTTPPRSTNPPSPGGSRTESVSRPLTEVAL